MAGCSESDIVEIVLIVTVGLVLIAAFAALVLQAREHRIHVQRLERLVAAKDLGEAAAVERIFNSPPASDVKVERKADEVDEMFKTPARPKERRT
jgi:hypothetical protein